MSEKLRVETNKILLLLATSELAHSFLYVTYTIYLISKGVSYYQIGILAVICSLAMILLDIPTGAFADVFGRKKAYMLSCLVWMAASATYIFSHNFGGYIAAELLAALAMSLSNGCVSAHLWDTVTSVGTEQGLLEEEIEENNKSLSAKVIWVTSPISAAGGFLGARLFEVHTSIPWIGTGAGMILVFFLAARVLHETKRKKMNFGRDVKEMFVNTALAFRVLSQKSGIRNIAMLRTLLNVTMVPLFLYWTAYLKEVGSSVFILGIAWILMEIAMSLGVYVCRQLPKRVQPQQIIVVSVLMVGVSAIVGAVTKSFVPVLLAILVIEGATTALGYVFGILTQKEITDLGYGEAGGENNMRATLLSSVSTTMTVGSMLGELSFGYSATKFGIPTSWLVAGLLTIAIAIGTYVLFGRTRDVVIPQTEGAA